MSTTLTISVSDQVLARLKERAAAAGITAEAVAADELERTLPKSATDPLMKWAGAFNCGPGDVSERHHEYLGEALYAEMRGEDSK